MIDLLGDRVFYDIEIKTPLFFGDKKLVDDVLKMVREKGIAHCSMISSFNPFVVRRARKKGFPLDCLSVDISTGKYYYDMDDAQMEQLEVETGFLEFLQKYLDG